MKRCCYLFVITIISLIDCSSAFAQAVPATIQTGMDKTLEINRQKIDTLDKILIETLGKRAEAVREIGIYKAKNNIPPLQAARFQQVLEKGIEAGKKEGLSAEFITEMLNAIHKESLRIEEDIKSK